MFMMTIRFFMGFSGSYCYKVMSFANRDSLTSLFPIWILFISPWCVIALARKSGTVFNKWREWGPLSCPDFTGNGFNISHFSLVMAVGLYYIDFIILSYIPTIPSFIRAFIMKGFEFCQRNFLHLLRWSCGFCLCVWQYILLHLVICICWDIPLSLQWNLLNHGI
jgi:hypothetical protein